MKLCIGINFLTALTGSEMLAVELASEAQARGWAVELLADQLDPDLAATLLDPAIKVTSDPDMLDLTGADVLYVQHQMGGVLVPKLAALWDEGPGDEWPFIVFAHVSINEGMETPGPFAEPHFADEIWCNSPETRETLISRYGSKFARAIVFHNPAPSGFAAVAPLPPGAGLRRVLAVSNHFPDEALEALEMVEAAGTEVTRCGQQFRQRRITPDLLAAHDAVFSIGKTVQYAMRAGRPAYCYDMHGGPGWLSEAGLDAAAAQNFSGRCTPGPRPARVIADELAEGFAPAAAYAARLRDELPDIYRLERWVAHLERAAAQRGADSARRRRIAGRLADAQVRGDLRQEAALAELQLSSARQRRRFQTQRERHQTQLKQLNGRIDNLAQRLRRLGAPLPPWAERDRA